MINNKTEIYIMSEGYSNAVESSLGYMLKHPVYSKFNINMSRPGDQMFHRFIPDIDLSLHGEDYDYFRALSPIYNQIQRITIRIYIYNYLGTTGVKMYSGTVSRQTSEWDHDKKKVTLDIEWNDSYSDILNNLDAEYNVLKLGVPSRNVSVVLQPILQVYQEGSTIVDNFIGGERFESSCDDSATEAELIDKYHFCKVARSIVLTQESDVDKIYLQLIAEKEGCEISDLRTPGGPYNVSEDLVGEKFFNLGLTNNTGFYINFRVKKQTADIEALETWISNYAKTYDMSFRYVSNGALVEDIEDLFEEDATGALVLRYPLGTIELGSLSERKVIGYAFSSPDKKSMVTASSKPLIYVFDGFSDRSKFLFSGASVLNRDYKATLILKASASLFARLIFRKKYDSEMDLLKTDLFNTNPKMYNAVIPFDSNSEAIFKRAKFYISSAYSTDDQDGANEYGCFVDNESGDSRYYVPPFNYCDNNTNPGWYPVLRKKWGTDSYWVTFGDASDQIYNSFWASLPYKYNYTVKDAYRVDDVIRALINKINENIGSSANKITVPSYSYEVKNAITPFNSPIFSRFFENYLYCDFTNPCEGRVPYFVPSSNIIAGEYDKAAQVWKLSLNTVFSWLRAMFNCHFSLRNLFLESHPVLSIENEVFYKQGYVYGRDYQGPSIDLTESNIKDSVNYKSILFGQDKTTSTINDIPKRIEFGSSGEDGTIFSSVNVDMAMVCKNSKGEVVADPIITDKCSVSKISPNRLYVDIDRINSTPDEFDKGATVMLLVDVDGNCGFGATYIYDGKNGKKWLSSSNFYASWIVLCNTHLHYTHSLDLPELDYDRYSTSSSSIRPYIDLINNGEVIGNDNDFWDSDNLNADPYKGLLPGKTTNVSIEFPLRLKDLTGEDIQYNHHDKLYSFKFNINGTPVKGITESAEINLLTNKAKFKVKTKPML